MPLVAGARWDTEVVAWGTGNTETNGEKAASPCKLRENTAATKIMNRFLGKNCPPSIALPLKFPHLHPSVRASVHLHAVVTESGGSNACCSKAKKEAKLVERKVCFILDASNGVGGWGQTSVQRSTVPYWQPGGKSFYRQREGLHAETAQSALTGILKLVMRWSDQCHLDCFKYN